MDWINIFGLIVVIIMMVPNMVYAYKTKQAENKCKSKIMNIIEQIGRYGSMFLMAFNIGIAEYGFSYKNGFAVWAICISILLILYYVFWLSYLKNKKMMTAILLAVIPSAIFILSGVLQRNWLLAVFGSVFSIGHIYITYKNHCEN